MMHMCCMIGRVALLMLLLLLKRQIISNRPVLSCQVVAIIVAKIHLIMLRLRLLLVNVIIVVVDVMPLASAAMMIVAICNMIVRHLLKPRGMDQLLLGMVMIIVVAQSVI